MARHEPELLLSGPGVEVLLVGSGSYAAGSVLPAVATVATTVRDLGRVLADRAGLDPARLTTVIDPADPRELGSALVASAARARDVLVVYYVGHGLVSSRNELHLATRATLDLRQGIAAHQALPYAEVREVISGCRAALTVLVLDCCFSGRAESAGRATADELFRTTRHGMYLLTSGGRDEVAWAPPDSPHTAFSGALIRLLTAGDATAPSLLTLDDVYRCLVRSLSEQGYPEPRRHAADHGDRQPLALNPAHSGGAEAGEFSPYRGLAAFGPADAPFFFGREDLTEHLLDRLAEQLTRDGPLLVAGPSGSGKSSLLGAGLIAVLDRASPGRCLRLTPGEDPLRTLAERFAHMDGSHPADLRQRLESEPSHLRELLAREPTRSAEPWVLIVDQFEELFTTCSDEPQRRAFIQAVHAACTGAQKPALVVIGMRADFSGHCADHPELLAALGRPVVVGPMTPGQLRRVIEEPAARSDLTLENGLTNLLLEDLAGSGRVIEPARAGGVLPLLSHALLATWQRREDRSLTLSGYRAVGGIVGALERTADATLHDLDLAGRRIARRLLPRLVRLGDGTDDTRRPVPLADLLPPPDSPDHAATRRALDHFTRARLISIDEDTVQLTHEALIHAWPQLRAWIDLDRGTLLVRQRLAEDAATWLRHDRAPAYLYGAIRLAMTRATMSAETGPPTPAEAAFLDAADRLSRRSSRIRRMVLLGLAALLLLALAGGGLGLAGQRVAQEQRRNAAAGDLMIQAAALREAEPMTALRLGIAAERIAPGPLTRDELMTTVLANHYTATVPAAARAEFSPNGRMLLAVGLDGIGTLWDLTDRWRPRRTAALPASACPRVTAIAFSPARDLLLTGCGNLRAVLWDVADPRGPRQLATLSDPAGTSAATGEHGPTQVTVAAFSADGGTALTASTDPNANADQPSRAGAPILWDMADPTLPRRQGRLSDASGPIQAINEVTMAAFRPDGRTVVTLAPDSGYAVLWEIRDRMRPRRATELPLGEVIENLSDSDVPAAWCTGVPQVCRAMATPLSVSPDGAVLVTGDSESAHATERTIVWAITGTTGAKLSAELDDALLGTEAADFSARGDTLAVVDGARRAVTVWDLRRPGRPARLASLTFTGRPGAVRNAVLSADGRKVLISGPDGTGTLWDVRPQGDPPPLTDLGDRVSSDTVTVFGGNLLLTGGGTGAVLREVTDPLHPRKLAELPTELNSPAAAAFSPRHDMVLIDGGDHDTAVLWDVKDPSRPRRLADLPGHNGQISATAFSLDGDTALTASWDGVAILWDVTIPTAPRRLATLRGHNEPVDAAVFSPDGKTVLTAGWDKKAILWDVTDRAHPQQQATLLGHTAEVYDAVFSPDGSMALTASRDSTAILWDITEPATPRRLATLIGHLNILQSAAFSFDGRMALTGSRDKTAILWDLTTPTRPRRLATLDARPPQAGLGDTDWVDAVAFRPDGRIVITGGTSAVLWDISHVRSVMTDPLVVACMVAGRALDQAEWARHVQNLPYEDTCHS
ncbi:caspase, EACC1-associated type [Nonomuraea jabiensis]|uniref:caspase, EACC1-associated type n=1 Tax=Nonomuraea jabiensis TaxID=882448 RepID=UPI003D764BF1